MCEADHKAIVPPRTRSTCRFDVHSDTYGYVRPAKYSPSRRDRALSLPGRTSHRTNARRLHPRAETTKKLQKCNLPESVSLVAYTLG